MLPSWPPSPARRRKKTMTQGENGARDWLLVGGTACALAISSGPIFHFSFAMFVVPLTQAFGVSRATVSLAPTIALFLIALATPLLGWLTDRYGSRNVVLASI